MATLYRAIKIDPWDETITEIEIDKDKTYEQLRELIGHGCRGIDFVYAIKKHFLVIDDEGLLHQPVPPLFLHRAYGSPLAGVGIILGNVPPEGDWGPATVEFGRVVRDVIFPGKRLKFEGFEYTEGKSKSPLFGDEEVPTFGTHALWSLDSEEEKK